MAVLMVALMADELAALRVYLLVEKMVVMMAAS